MNLSPLPVVRRPCCERLIALEIKVMSPGVEPHFEIASSLRSSQ